ncbi:MAG: sugar kinase [Beijerinckiaceae bacterium]
MTRDVIAIGECMVEMSRGADGRYGLAYGGDTFNTSVYLARMGCDVAYASALGDDPYSDAIETLAKGEDIDTALIFRREGRTPGLYMIETSPTGERKFFYWRDRAPAREVLEDTRSYDAIRKAMADAKIVYFSGITLSLYSSIGLTRLEQALRNARSEGATVVFDGNYRPRGWHNDADRARKTMRRFLKICDVVMPTFDDEVMLWGDSDPEATVARIRDFGPTEVIVKCGADGALAYGEGIIDKIPVPEPISPLDTTAAGDSFNAGFLAARLEGDGIREAVLAGHDLAGIVIRHRGAIVPKAATDILFDGDDG